MRNLVFFLVVVIGFLGVVIEARQAPSFAKLEGSINGKLTSFNSNCNGKLNTFQNSVNGKLDAWNSNFKSSMNNFQNSVNSKCDGLSSNVSNKLNALQSSMNSKFDKAGFSAFKNDSNNAFKSFGQNVADAKNQLKSSLQVDLGAGFSAIQSDWDAFNSSLQSEATDIAGQFDEGGDLSDAVDTAATEAEAENNPPPAMPSVIGAWKQVSGYYRLDFPAGTWTLRGSGHVVHIYGNGGSSQIGPDNVNVGYTFTANTSGFMTAFGEDSGTKTYLVKGDSNQLDPGPPPLDSDGDGSSDAEEEAAGTNPNDANSKPAPPLVEKTPETAVDIGSATTGISSLDEIIKKLSPNFSAFSTDAKDDFSITIPIRLGSFYSADWQIGPFDVLLDGKLIWMRTIIRGFTQLVMSFVFVKSLITVFRQW